jgi:purine-nucleoside phosphorylase
MAAGVVDKSIHHEEVMEIGRRVEVEFTALLKALVPQIASLV